MSLISLVRINDIDRVRGYDNIVNEINLHDDKETALIIASKYNYIEIVKLLLTNETINVNLQNSKLDTALILASWHGYIEIVKLLLKIESINVNLHDDDRDTALMCASKYNYIEIAKILLENETINVNLQNCDENTALILASWFGYIEIVKLLLDNETINVNLQDSSGDSALICASENNYIEIVELLLAKGAIIKIPANNNYSNYINGVLTNWKTYLPKWNRFKTYRYYPKEFKDIAIQWLLICKRKNFVSKDIKLLMIEYLAESWKVN